MTTKGHAAITSQVAGVEQEARSTENRTSFIQVALIVFLFIAYILFEPHSPVWQLI